MTMPTAKLNAPIRPTMIFGCPTYSGLFCTAFLKATAPAKAIIGNIQIAAAPTISAAAALPEQSQISGLFASSNIVRLKTDCFFFSLFCPSGMTFLSLARFASSILCAILRAPTPHKKPAAAGIHAPPRSATAPTTNIEVAHALSGVFGSRKILANCECFRANSVSLTAKVLDTTETTTAAKQATNPTTL